MGISCPSAAKVRELRANKLWATVIAADGLYKRDILSETPQPHLHCTTPSTWPPPSPAILSFGELVGFPDPFAVVTVDGEQTHTTSVIRKTLNPYWNESFDMYIHPHQKNKYKNIK